MDGALPNYGCAISIMIAVMTPTNRRTCAGNETAQPVGNDAPANRTIDAYQNGCSAMVKMIVATTVMNCQKIVRPATPKPISSVATIVASQSKSIQFCATIENDLIYSIYSILDNGFAILPMIVVMVATKWRPFAKENIVNALNRNSDVRMANAFRRDGDAITRTTAVTIQTKRIARIINAKMERFNALRVIVLQHISVVMAIVIVAICPTKPIVHHDSQAVDTVPNHDFNAPIICVSQCLTFAMAPTIVATTATKRHRFARISIAIRCDVSNVPTIVALLVIKYAMASIIAATAATKITIHSAPHTQNHAIKSINSNAQIRNASIERMCAISLTTAVTDLTNWDVIIRCIAVQLILVVVNNNVKI